MIKIYDLLFEQDNTSFITSSSSTTQDPEKFKEVITTAVKDAVKEPLNSIQAWIKQSSKEDKTKPTPSNAESTTSTSGTKPTSPSKPAGVTTAGSPQEKDKDSKNLAASISKDLTANNQFIDTLASKIKTPSSV